MQRTVLGLITCLAIVAAGCSSSSTSGGGGPPPASSPVQKSVTKVPVPIGDTSKPIFGVWTLPEPKDDPMGGGKIAITLEFTEDGKSKHTLTMNGKDQVDEGTYKRDGNQLEITANGMTHHVTIRKVTDDELTISDAKKGEDATFIRKKK